MLEYTVDGYAEYFYNKYKDTEYQINQGASVLLIKENKVYFALAKEESWEYVDNKIPNIKFTGIGGTKEKKEIIFDTLRREIKEEVNIEIQKLQFANVKKTIIVRNNAENSNIEFEKGLTPNPLYIVQFELPLRNDIKSEGKKYSCLQLFVYIAKVDKNVEIIASNTDNITGIISADNEQLEKYIDGNCLIENYNNILWKKKYERNLLSNIIVNPKFTPKGIRMAGLKLSDLLSYFEGGKDE